MNCAESKELLVGYIEELLAESQKQALESHLKACPPCRAELTQLTGLRDRLTANGKALAQSDLENKVLDHILHQQSLKLRKANKLDRQFRLWRKIMKSRITKLTAAAAIIIVAALSLNLFEKSIPTASAAEVLAEAAEAMAKLRSVYIKTQIRTLPRDNFELIGLNYDFVPNEMWKVFDGTFHGKWRVEKPGRVVVMDGQSSLLLIKPNYAAKGGVGTGFVQWLKLLLDVDKVLDKEIELARIQGSELHLAHEQGPDGLDKLVVTVEAYAQGDFTNDWLKNKSISASDNQRIYTFDAETKLLETLEVYVHTEEEDVLVLEITDIEYNLEIDPALFTLELPQDVIWFEQPKVVENNEDYQQMTPKEMAIAFFQACADEDWDEAVKFWRTGIADERVRKGLGGLHIISIGEPFQSGLYPGWFVPYQVKYKSGRVWKFNLAVRNDNPARRYVVDGGIGGF